MKTRMLVLLTVFSLLCILDATVSACNCMCWLYNPCQVCEDGECVCPLSAECCDNSDCPPDQPCGNCICRECNSDSDCPYDKKCVNGKCKDCGTDSDCPPGKKCVNNTCKDCIQDSDCPPGQFCINNECKDCRTDSDCLDCQKCENNNCVDCKCWDAGSAITGTINVQNAEICECVTHTSNITDIDHWIDGSGNVGYPTDTITYLWWASDGTWLEDRLPSFEWTAPANIGWSIIGLTAGDLPNTMSNPCPSSTRDDQSLYLADSVDVTLPSGCQECSGNPTITLDPRDYNGDYTENPPCCSEGYCGCTGPAINVQTSVTICYSGGKWKFGASATADLPWGPCVSYFIEISGGNDEDININNFCAIIDCFIYDPNDEATGTGCCSVGSNVYSNEECIIMHESYHDFDYVNKLGQEETDLAGNPVMSDVIIDCDNPDTIDCADALSSKRDSIEQAIREAYDRASGSCDEEGARGAAEQCFLSLAASICNAWLEWECEVCN